jgi:hypothetical protein
MTRKNASKTLQKPIKKLNYWGISQIFLPEVWRNVTTAPQ